MADYFEIDFLDVETKKSGDAIAVRYSINDVVQIHVVDGGYLETGERLASHIRQYYGNPDFIDRVVVTHPDGDHANGLRTIIEEFDIGELWMLRPWTYAAQVLHRFTRFTTVEGLENRLREIYSSLAALEDLAHFKGIPIYEPFQGAELGAFTVMAPTRERYLDMIVESERTPESVAEAATSAADTLLEAVGMAVVRAVNMVKAAWGAEVFPPDDTSAENEMSVIQYANICGKKILLTGDAGRSALAEAADYAPFVGLALPGIDRFQVPHHGSRRNVSTVLLDRWLGPRMDARPGEGYTSFTAIISSAKADEDHPRKAVVRACIHRGGYVISTEGQKIYTYHNAPDRGWTAVPAMGYPDDQEE